MADMKIIIGADIKNLQSELAKAGGVTQNFANQTTAANAKVGASFATMGAASKTAATSISSVGSALGNVARGLLTGGIASGIALITGALLVMVKSFFEASEASKRLKEENEKITKTFLEAADAAGEEMGKVTLLKTVLESENATRLQKVTALKELKKINHDYFGQLDIEDGKVKGLTTAYDGYIQRIVRSINAKANVDLLTDAYKEQAAALAQINQNLKAGDKLYTASNLTQFQIQDAIRRFGLTFGAKKGESVIIDLKESQLIADLLNAEAKIKSITANIKDSIIDAFNPKIEKIEKTKKTKSWNSTKNPYDKWKGAFLGPDVPKMTIKPDVTIAPNVKDVIVEPGQQKKVFDGLKALLDAEKLQNLSDEFDALITDTINSSIVNAAESLGESIADFAASGKFDLPNLFGGLMRNLGAQIQQLGKFLITSSGLIKAAKEAFKTLLANPTASAVVGVGLIALGAILKAQAAKQYKGFASGTTGVSQGGFYDVGERGRERVFLPQGSKVQPANEVQAFGGGGVMLQPSIHYEGTGFRIMLNRVDAQMSRNG